MSKSTITLKVTQQVRSIDKKCDRFLNELKFIEVGYRAYIFYLIILTANRLDKINKYFSNSNFGN